MTSHPHDALAKGIFGSTPAAIDQFRCALPAKVFERIDWATLALCSGSSVDPALNKLHSDLLFSVRTRTGSECLLYLLLEHQSTNDPLLPVRLLIYQVRVIERFLQDHPKAGKVPPVIPVVLTHAEGGWRGSARFATSYDVDAGTLDILDGWILDFRILVDDLDATDDETLRLRTASEIARFAWWFLKHARHLDEELSCMREWAKEYRALCNAPGGATALDYFLSYILENKPGRDPEAIRALFRSLTEPGSPEETMTQKRIVSIADHLRAEGMLEGERKLAEALEGHRRALRNLLERRFGALGSEHLLRIQRADAASLERWTERILDANSVSAVLED